MTAFVYSKFHLKSFNSHEKLIKFLAYNLGTVHLQRGKIHETIKPTVAEL